MGSFWRLRGSGSSRWRGGAAFCAAALWRLWQALRFQQLAGSELVSNNDECWQICPQAEGCSSFLPRPLQASLLVSYNAS